MTELSPAPQPGPTRGRAPAPLTVGIIGAGQIAIAHARAYESIAGIHLAGVASRSPDRAAVFCEAHTSGAVPYRSVIEMLGEQQLDAVSVCVSNAAHHAVTIEALRAGMHVFCEKPPALNTAQAVEMRAEAERADRVLGYGLVYRHMAHPLLLFVEEIGPVYRAEARWVRARGIPGWGSYGSAAVAGGGALIDLGVHVLDLAWYLMGKPAPRKVSARTWQHKAKHSLVGLMGSWDAREFEVEDHGTATVDFDSARLTLEAAFATDTSVVESVSVELQGVHGRLVIPLMTGQPASDPACAPTLHGERHGALISTVIGPPWPMTVADGYRAELTHFAAACRGEAEPLAGPTDGVVIQGLLDAMYVSAEQGGSVVDL